MGYQPAKHITNAVSVDQCGQQSEPSTVEYLIEGHARIFKATAELWARLRVVLKPTPCAANQACSPSPDVPTLRDYARASHRLADDLEGLAKAIDL